MFKILTDVATKAELIGRTLTENARYFIVLDNAEDPVVTEFFLSAAASGHIHWHRGNRVAELCIKNHVGKFRILDIEFDVRSTKFNSELTGAQQVKLIVDELDALSTKMSFSYDSSIFNNVSNDWTKPEHDVIHKLNYLYHCFFDVRDVDTAPSLFKRAIHNPSTSPELTEKYRHYWEMRKVTPGLIPKLLKKGIGRSAGSAGSGGDTRLKIATRTLSNNTPDNQFLKYFFEYSEQIALTALNPKTALPKRVTVKAQRLKSSCRQILTEPFFAEIHSEGAVNTNSTVLNSRDGYRDLLLIYTNSLFSFKHIFEDSRSELQVDLVDIASLYEMWCFYTLAYEILGTDILVSAKSSVIKGNAIRYSTVFENDSYQVGYNQTFSRSNRKSYSITLRPDISVRAKATGAYYHFDAKYRVKSLLDTEQEALKSYRNDDVGKMHAYLDAIHNSKSAVVLYPGSSFRFFVNSNPSQVIENTETDFPLNGVGAVSLIPGSDNLQLQKLVNTFFKPISVSP